MFLINKWEMNKLCEIHGFQNVFRFSTKQMKKGPEHTCSIWVIKNIKSDTCISIKRVLVLDLDLSIFCFYDANLEDHACLVGVSALWAFIFLLQNRASEEWCKWAGCVSQKCPSRKQGCPFIRRRKLTVRKPETELNSTQKIGDFWALSFISFPFRWGYRQHNKSLSTCNFLDVQQGRQLAQILMSQLGWAETLS